VREIKTIATLASHSALQILKGAKEEGFETIAICLRRRLGVYERFRHFIDRIIVVDDFKEIVNKDIQKELFEMRAILIPHGSFVEYLGIENIERIEVPIFGNKKLMIWEHDAWRKLELLEKSGIRTPKLFRKIDEVDRPVIVKFHGAKGGRGYFVARNSEELRNKLAEKGLDASQLIIQEYIFGTPMYFHYFYSPILKRLELLGADIRYESEVDGIKRYPYPVEDYTFTVVGNIPLVLRESLLEQVFDYGEKFVVATRNLIPPGVIGPFCLEAICKSNLEIVVFEFSGRIVAGTNLYVHGSPYSWLYFNEPMSTGRRIAREIKLAIEKNALNKIIVG